MIVTSHRALMASAAALFLLGACNTERQANSNSSGEKSAIEATVNGVTISQRRVDLIANQDIGSGQPDSPGMRKEIVDQLVIQTLIAEEAVKKGLDKSAEIAERFDLSRQTVLADAYVRDFIKNNSVSEDALNKEYERFKSGLGNEYKARHILVNREAEARELIARLQEAPGSFATLAQETSKDTSTRTKGGDLGWFDPRRMSPEFGAAVKLLAKGKFTETPVRTSYGYHVILLEDSRPLEAPPLDRIKAGLTQQLQQQSLMKHLDDLKARAKIEIAEASSGMAQAPASKPK